MPHAARMPYRDPDQTTTTWVLIFVLASLLVHALLVLGFIVMSIYLPEEKLNLVQPQNPEVSLSLLPPPPALQPAPPPQFMPTQPQQNVTPKNTPIISDNDTNLTSPSKQSRNPNAVMPDVTSMNSHPDSLQQSPNSPSQQKPEPGQPTPKQEQAQKAQPTPPQPKPEQPQPKQNPPTPNPSTAETPPPTPSKSPPPPKPVQYDPNGLPELPAINAPTLAPQTPMAVAQSGAPPSQLPQVPADIQGKVGLSGSPSPDAMATELGKYKAMIYRAVGSRWYPKVDQHLQTLPVGSVRIEYTVHSDGTVSTTVRDSGNSTMQTLLSISRDSITEAAPFEPFSPALLKELGTDSFTDDFTFSVYGP